MLCDHTEALLYHARSATPFCSVSGDVYVSVPSGLDSRRVLRPRSAGFRDWLTANYYNEYEAAPPVSAFRAAIHVLEARAAYSGGERPRVHYRVGFDGDPHQPERIFIDLANQAGELIEISSQGWEVTGNLRCAFLETSTALALPRPERLNGANPMDEIAHLFQWTEIVRTRALTWLACALRPVGPYPILVVRGPAGCGKSVLARALRGLIDPCRDPAKPRLQPAAHNWVHVFDASRQTGAKQSRVMGSTGRAAIIVGRTELDAAAGFPKAIAIDLKPVAIQRSEAELCTELEVYGAALMAALADALAGALRSIHAVEPRNVARLQDCATWAVAVGAGLGLREESVVEVLGKPAWARWAG